MLKPLIVAVRDNYLNLSFNDVNSLLKLTFENKNNETL